MSWSKQISTDYHVIQLPSYPDGALIDVEFQCGNCGQTLEVCVEIPQFFAGGDTEAESRRWGDREPVECECGESYEVSADNSIAGWMVEFESEKPPKTFRYRVRKYYGEPEEDETEY